MRPVRFQRKLFDGRIGRLSWRPLSFPALASSLAARGPVVPSNLAGAMETRLSGGPPHGRPAAAPAIGKSGSVLVSFFVGHRTDNLLKAEICLRARLSVEQS